jgi:hypothetical protein
MATAMLKGRRRDRWLAAHTPPKGQKYTEAEVEGAMGRTRGAQIETWSDGDLALMLHVFADQFNARDPDRRQTAQKVFHSCRVEVDRRAKGG